MGLHCRKCVAAWVVNCCVLAARWHSEAAGDIWHKLLAGDTHEQ